MLIVASAARAHDADIIYATLKHADGPGVLEELLTLTAPTLAMLAPLDADGDGALSQADLDAKTKALEAGVWDDLPLTAGGLACERLETRALLRDGFIELDAKFRCGEGALHQDFRILRVLPTNYRVVLGSQLDGEGGARGFAQGSLTAINLPRPPAPGAWDAGQFSSGFDEGARRVLSLDGLGALAGVLLAIGAWRRGLLALGLVAVSVVASSFVAGQWLGPTAVLALVAFGAAASKETPLVLGALVGLALGARGGGGAWPLSLGLGLGSLVAVVPLGVCALAVGVMLRRRPGVLRVARWAPVVCVLVGAVLGASRLSW